MSMKKVPDEVSNLVKRTILKIKKKMIQKNRIVSNLVKRTILKIKQKHLKMKNESVT